MKTSIKTTILGLAFAVGFSFAANAGCIGTLQASNNLSDVCSAATSLSNLGGLPVVSVATGDLVWFSNGPNELVGSRDINSQAHGLIKLGASGSSNGQIQFTNASNSSINVIEPTGTYTGYNFYLPSTVGTSGQVMASAAGATTGMTWLTPGTLQTALSFSGTAPTVSSCGTSPAIDGHATNFSGTVTVGTGAATSCTITFASSGFTTWNHCRVTDQSAVTSPGYTYTKTAIVVTATSLIGDVIDYECDGS